MGRKKITNYLFNTSPNLTAKVEQILKILDCGTTVRALPSILKAAEEEKVSYLEFIDLLFEPEMQKKEDGRVLNWQKQARFPWVKELVQYDFSYPEYVEKEKVLKLAECEWIENGGNVVFFGPPGVGKTHLSIALGLEAIRKGHETRFIVVDRLTEMIAVAMGKDRIAGSGENRKKLLSSFSNVKLLILDELAYSKIDQEVADFLFQLICRRYDLQTSTIFTSNEGFDKWGRFFGDNENKALAAIDRIIERCAPVSIRGQSFRTRGVQNILLRNNKINT